MPAALAEELKFVNIFTIEQLASLDDNYVARIPKGHEWKQKAQAFLGALKDQEQVSKLQAELQARDNKIEALEVALKDQAAKIETLLKKQK
jgi:predicted  nucleic acid-binding Zn-ribbon protein